VDVGEGGVSVVLAGEVEPGESVGISLQLPFVLEPVQAKAVIRHQGPLRCGIQFIAMSAEQLNALRTWARMAEERLGVPLGPELVAKSHAHNLPRLSRASTRVRRRNRVPAMESTTAWRPQLRWALLAIVLTLGGLIWWWSSWNQPEDRTAAAALIQQSVVKVPGSEMQRHLLHRVDPEYPPEAERTRLQGLVVLNVSIAPDGAVKNVAHVSGPPLLALAAKNAVQWWRFQPYQVNGQAVPVETTVEIDFQLPK
jgi:TonB family protein